MADLKFVRKGKTIETLAEAGRENSRHTFKSINEAKRESRRLQQANGGMGMGSLQVMR